MADTENSETPAHSFEIEGEVFITAGSETIFNEVVEGFRIAIRVADSNYFTSLKEDRIEAITDNSSDSRFYCVKALMKEIRAIEDLEISQYVINNMIPGTQYKEMIVITVKASGIIDTAVAKLPEMRRIRDQWKKEDRNFNDDRYDDSELRSIFRTEPEF